LKVPRGGAGTLAALVLVAGRAAALVPLQDEVRGCAPVREALARADAAERVAALAVIHGQRPMEPRVNWVRAQGRWWRGEAGGYVAASAPVGSLVTIGARVGAERAVCVRIARTTEPGEEADAFAIGERDRTELPDVVHVSVASARPVRVSIGNPSGIPDVEDLVYGEEVDDPGVDRVTRDCRGGFTGGGSTSSVWRDGTRERRSWVYIGRAPPKVERPAPDPALAAKVFAVVDRHSWPAGQSGSPGNVSCSLTVRIGGRNSIHYTTGATQSRQPGLVDLGKALGVEVGKEFR
jgi:hypothetical protein